MTFLQLIFYFFAVMAVASAVAVITVRNPVHSVLSLVGTFFAMSAIWMLLHAEFLSLILLLVYVGAVMTLFLFVVMMLSIGKETRKSSFVRYLPFGVLLTLLFIGLMAIVVGPQYFGVAQMPIPAAEVANVSNTQQLGSVLYTDYAYAFEIAGVILLSAIIAAITLTYRGPVHRKVQQPEKQVAVRPEDRVRLIKMPGKPKEEGAS